MDYNIFTRNISHMHLENQRISFLEILLPSLLLFISTYI